MFINYKYLFVIGLMAQSLIIKGMERDESEQMQAPMPHITIEDYYGQQFIVSSDQVKNIGFFDLNSLFNVGNNSSTVSFNDTAYGDNTHVSLTSDILQPLISCVNDSKMCEQITDEDAIIKLLYTAEYLNAGHILRPLTVQARKIVPYDKWKKYPCVKSGKYLRSIKDVLEEEKKSIEEYVYRGCLYLKQRKLDTLSGLPELIRTLPEKTVRALNVENNKLTVLNFYKLWLKCGIKEVNASSNRISKVIMLKKLPDNLIVNLNNNWIEHFPKVKKFGTNNQIWLKDNPLNEETFNSITNIQDTREKSPRLLSDTMFLLILKGAFLSFLSSGGVVFVPDCVTSSIVSASAKETLVYCCSTVAIIFSIMALSRMWVIMGAVGSRPSRMRSKFKCMSYHSFEDEERARYKREPHFHISRN